MNNNNENTLKVLYKIIEVNKNGNDGYKNASEKMENEELKTILYRLSQQRALFEAELKNEIRAFGGDPENAGSFTGDIQKVWKNLRAGILGSDTDSILEECQRADKAAIESYEDALKEELPQYIKDKLQEQFKFIKGAYNQLLEFEENED